MRTSILLVLFCVLASLGVAQAQQIDGTVTDPSGAVIRAATVQLTCGEKLISTTKTDNRGAYSLRVDAGVQEPASVCQVSVSAPGFAPVLRRVELAAERHQVLPVRMEISSRREAVEVSDGSKSFSDQLDLSEVRESTAKDVGEALEDVDGVAKIRKAGIANDVVVRGFKQGNINFQIDGARIFGACPGQMDPPAQHVDFAEVERVDVIKGPFNVASAGGLGATVNVVTKTPPEGFRVTPSMIFGGFNYVNPNITASYGNKKFRALAGYSYRSADSYKDGSGKTITSYATYNSAALNEKAFEINTGWFDTELSPTENQKISVNYTHQNSGLVLYPYETMDADYDIADRAGIKYELRNLDKVRALRFQAYFTNVDHYMSDSQRLSAMNGAWTMASDAKTRALGGRFEADLGRDLTMGFESYTRNWDVAGFMRSGMMTSGPRPTVPNVDTRASGVFADYHHSFGDKLRLNAGVRYDHDSMSTGIAGLNTDGWFKYQNTRADRMTDDYASGNVRLSYTLPHSIDFFAGIGTTGRVPDAEERFMNRVSAMSVWIGNPNLPITRNTEVDAGVNFRHGASYIKPTVFYSKLGDFILVNEQPLLNGMSGMGTPATARSYTNVEARVYGGELTYALALPKSFTLSGGTSYSRGTNDVKPQAGVFSSTMPEMPPLRAWTSLRYTHKITFIEVGGAAASRQNRVDTDLSETPTAGYGVMNLKLGMTYHKLYATFVIDNLLNHFYYEHLSYFRDVHSSGVKVPEPGRNFFAQLKYRF